METLLAVVVGGALTIAGSFFVNRWTANERAKREHNARVHGWRADAYKDILQVHHAQAVRIEMFMPVLDRGETPPDPPSPPDLARALAGSNAFGSPAVREAVEALRKINNAFYITVETYKSAEARGTGPGSEEQFDRYRAVEGLRQQYRDGYRGLADRIAKELQEQQ